tara:strand:+ start:921 stop:1115 length:195 start_codon:yes stop_codon:yes gene_type:complete
MNEVKEKNCTGDPCLWLCFPCLFTWMLCEKGLQSCCMCICCMTPNSQETINIEEFKEETKEDIN